MKYGLLAGQLTAVEARTGAMTDAAATGAVGTTKSIMAYVKQLVTAQAAQNTVFQQALESSAYTPNGAAQGIFTITGGPILCVGFYGIVTTDIGGTAMNLTLQELVTTPSATVTVGTTVSGASKAAGTSIRWINTTGILTPVTAGIVPIYPATIATLDIQVLFPIGIIQMLSSAANTGVIKWYMVYQPLSQNTVVAAV